MTNEIIEETKEEGEGFFESKILGIVYERDRLNELQQKAKTKGLRGDEVFEFIHLDRQVLVEKLQQKDERIKELEEREKKLLEFVKFYSNTKNIELTGLNLAGKRADVDLSELRVVARQCLKELGE